MIKEVLILCLVAHELTFLSNLITNNSKTTFSFKLLVETMSLLEKFLTTFHVGMEGLESEPSDQNTL